MNPLSSLGNLGSLDSGMAQAESLMTSNSLSDQVQGQMEMQQVMQKFNAISTFIKNLGDAEQQAINNSKSHG